MDELATTTPVVERALTDAERERALQLTRQEVELESMRAVNERTRAEAAKLSAEAAKLSAEADAIAGRRPGGQYL